MTEVFVVFAVVYIAFVAWYVKDSSVCHFKGHDFKPYGGVFMSCGYGKHQYYKTYRCMKCGKITWWLNKSTP